MSLLMKALANAEENKRVLVQQAQQEDSEKQQAAANIFSAGHHPHAPFSLFMNGLIVLIVIGIFWFSYKLYQLNQIPSNLAMNTLPVQQPSIRKTLNAEPTQKTIVAVTTTQPKAKTQPQKTLKNSTKGSTSTKIKMSQKVEKKVAPKTSSKLNDVAAVETNEVGSHKVQNAETQVAINHAQTLESPAAGPAQIKVEHKVGGMVLDQRLQNAYQAFVSGNTNEAKSLYRSVLKQDIYQTDALLGMAAIAQKQGRFADASGWYQKALKTDPKNPVALAGLAATRPQQSPISQEQRLKKLISQQPYHAQHYANLGNLYAAQRAWTKAQAAFFEANRHDKQNAQFAFNLAVSLEHLGKPSLAVQHYQRALDLVRSQNLSVPNATQIQQRLDVLQ